MDVAYSYTKKRLEFGIQCHFHDIQAEVVNAFEPTNPSVIEVDTTASKSESTVGTERVEMCQKGMHHAEGGWPKEVDIDDIESKNRFRKKSKAGPLSEGLKKVGPLIVESVRQNSTINLFEEFFEGEGESHSSEPPSAKGLAKFRDPNDIKRSVSQISWSPEGPLKIAGSYSILNFQDQRFVNENLPHQSYIWDINNPNVPEMELCPVSPLCCLKFGKSSDSIVGGSYNGLITFFDIRKSGKTPCDKSQIEYSHHDPVYDVQWIQSKTGTQCASVSTDGRMLWWDVRKLLEPIDSNELCESESGDTLEQKKLYGGSSMAYLQEAGPTKYLVGTEQGVVVTVNTRNKPGSRNTFSDFTNKHHSTIYSIERNPIHPKFFLTVGDWTARIWSEDLKTPIMMTKHHQSYLTAGCWSPTRPSVFYLTRKDGVVDVWDYFQTQSEVVYSHKVGDVSLTSIGIHSGQRGSGGRFIAIGDEDGTISLLEVCESLSQMRTNEKAAILSVFERETKREKNVAVRTKEKKRLQMQIGQEIKAESDINKESSAEKMNTILKKVEDDFDEIVKSDKKADKPVEVKEDQPEEEIVKNQTTIEDSKVDVGETVSTVIKEENDEFNESFDVGKEKPSVVEERVIEQEAPVETQVGEEPKEEVAKTEKKEVITPVVEEEEEEEEEEVVDEDDDEDYYSDESDIMAAFQEKVGEDGTFTFKKERSQVRAASRVVKAKKEEEKQVEDVVTESNEEVKETTEEVKETTEEVKETTGDVKEEVKETTDEVKETTGEVKETTGEVKETTEEVKEEVKETTEEVKEITDEVKETTDEVKEITDEVKETTEEVKEMTDEVKETTEEVKETTEEVKEITEEVKETTDEVKETTEEVKETTEEVKENDDEDEGEEVESNEEGEETTEEVKETTEEAKETQEEAKEDVEEAKETQEEAKEDVEEAKETQEEAKESVEEVKETTEEVKETQEEAKESVEEVKETIEETKSVEKVDKVEESFDEFDESTGKKEEIENKESKTGDFDEFDESVEKKESKEEINTNNNTTENKDEINTQENVEATPEVEDKEATEENKETVEESKDETLPETENKEATENEVAPTDTEESKGEVGDAPKENKETEFKEDFE